MRKHVINISDVALQPRPPQFAPNGPAAERYEAALALMERGQRDAPERPWLLIRLALMRRYVNPRQSIGYLDEVLAGRAGAIASPLVAALQYCRGAMRCLGGELRGGVEEMAEGVGDAAHRVSSWSISRLRCCSSMARWARAQAR